MAQGALGCLIQEQQPQPWASGCAQGEASIPQAAPHAEVVGLTFLVMLTWKPKGCGVGMGIGAVPLMVTQSHAVQLQPNPTALRAGAA